MKMMERRTTILVVGIHKDEQDEKDKQDALLGSFTVQTSRPASTLRPAGALFPAPDETWRIGGTHRPGSRNPNGVPPDEEEL